MLIPKIKIEVGNYVFQFVHSLEVVSGYEFLTDTAEFELPRKFNLINGTTKTKVEWVNKDGNDFIKIGDLVKISIGYDKADKLIFEGFVVKVSVGVPVKIECEDYMYAAKQQVVSYYKKEAKLSALLSFLKSELSKNEYLKEITISTNVALDLNLGEYKVRKATIAQVFDDLEKKHSVFSFFRNKTLYVGNAASTEGSKTVKFVTGKNVIRSENLQYVQKESQKTKVVVKCVGEDGKAKQETYGDPDGRVIHLQTNKPDQMKAVADNYLNSTKYDKYIGEFEAFWLPIVKHGDLVDFKDEVNNRPDGKFVAKMVKYTFDTRRGSRQFISPSKKS